VTDEELDLRIRALPHAPLSAALAARVHARAWDAFEGGSGVGRLARIATAAAVTSAVTIYLAWAVEFLNALARG
jgi:hypothetical protein